MKKSGTVADLALLLAVAELGVDVAHAIDDLDDHLLPLLDGVHTVMIDHSKSEWLAHLQELGDSLRQSRKKVNKHRVHT